MKRQNSGSAAGRVTPTSNAQSTASLPPPPPPQLETLVSELSDLNGDIKEFTNMTVI